jgi:hypothetical protein
MTQEVADVAVVKLQASDPQLLLHLPCTVLKETLSLAAYSNSRKTHQAIQHV